MHRLKRTGLAVLLIAGIGSMPLLFAAGMPSSGSATDNMPMMNASGTSTAGRMAGTSGPQRAMTGRMMGNGMMSMMPQMNRMMATGNQMMQRMVAYMPPAQAGAPTTAAAHAK
ncbi:MAG: hypothetical protein B7Z66_13460 [Chromatiales bacterium 21-64-14]|nr:MAG: hypothetical protein B7Z66_13460 [Chromatiales bacterium 21-64-14]HQU17097.1 hypothetical protein [Gammaproteobacteria bacterium]